MIRIPQSHHKRYSWVLIAISLVALVLGSVIAISLGAVRVPVESLFRIIISRLPGVDVVQNWTSSQEAIILYIRMPRVLAAIVVGAALAVAGTIFQALLRNPLADPYIMGTSSGAGLGATIAIYLLPQVSLIWLRLSLVSMCAFLGAIAAVVMLVAVARVGKQTPVTTLVLAGFALGAMLSAVIHFLMLLNDAALLQVTLWLMGSVSTVTWQEVLIISPIVLVGIVTACFFAIDLNAFLVGDEQAAHIGLNVERRKMGLLFLGALITASVVSISGLIGFVGLVVPHVMRLIFGPDNRVLLPASAIVGGLFLTLADLVARTALAPAEVPVGIVTALVGAPFFIYQLRRRKRQYSF